MYEIILSPLAKKDLGKLNKEDRERIVAVLQKIRIRPFAFVKRLVGVNHFSLRAGKHRVILDIKKGKLIIFVIEIGHRKNIYKNL
mgnify:CR=1 FL=1|jgi:mRNA interferase RelE/StbE